MHVVDTDPESAAHGRSNLPEAQTPAQRALVLCVDDEPSILSALRRVLARDRHEVLVASSGAEGLEILAERSVDLIISDMRMPHMSGAQFLTEAASRWPDTVRLLLTGDSDLESAVSAVNEGGIYRYLTKPWSDDDLKLTVREAVDKRRMKDKHDRLLAITRTQNEELTSLNSELESRVHQRTEQLREAYATLKGNFQGTLEMFSHMLDLHDSNSAGHGRRVADLARAIGESTNLDASALTDLENAALLHDIGKLALPERLRHQAYEKLDLAQRQEFERHADYGAAVLGLLGPLSAAAQITAQQYARYDASGSADDPGAEQLRPQARILAAANGYDELRHGTLTGSSMSVNDAIDALRIQAGKRFDPQIIEQLGLLVSAMEGEQPASPITEITVSELCAGMELAEDLRYDDRVVLLRKGQVLTAGQAGKLKNVFKRQASSTKVHVRTQTL